MSGIMMMLAGGAAPREPYTVEYLVLAGGASGGKSLNTANGGGGAGGHLEASETFTPDASYTVTIGAGGAAHPWAVQGQGNSGSNSILGTVSSGTATGGGGGGNGSSPTVSGLAGGSGGGSGGFAYGSSNPGGSGTSGQGNDGGLGFVSSAYVMGGGGGGAGAAGLNGGFYPSAPPYYIPQAGAGGGGKDWQSLGTTRAGGGGGAMAYYNAPFGGPPNSFSTQGAGGSGGGTAGAANWNGSASPANSGGGAGALSGPSSNVAGNGGSGVVILRYSGTQQGTGGTVTSAGGYTYHTFNSSGTYVAQEIQMAHYALVVDGIVQQVIVADEDHISTLEGDWVKTSYNMNGGIYYVEATEDDGNGGTRATRKAADDQSIITGDEARERKNFAAVGGNYDGTGFYDAKPYDSWILNSESYGWEPPTEMPDDGKIYSWDESSKSWVEFNYPSPTKPMPTGGQPHRWDEDSESWVEIDIQDKFLWTN